jgi:hypothetical protein
MDEKKQQSRTNKEWKIQFDPTGAASSKNRVRVGDICPRCQNERLDYNGMLNLVCPNCGVIEGGCFT